MTIYHLLSHAEPLLTAAARLWAVGSEAFTITIILWTLRFIADLIETTYAAGYAIGKFYRRHLHKPCKWLLINFITLIILCLQLAFEGAQLIYRNRQEYITTLNSWRNQIGRLFIYESPTAYQYA